MERRRFLAGLIGCLAAATLAPAMAEAAAPRSPEKLPPDAPLPDAVEVSAETKAALDDADKEFSQYYYRRRVIYRRPVRRVVYRRPVRRVVYRQPVRRVYYRQPVRRVYYRPVVYRRPVRVIRFY